MPELMADEISLESLVRDLSDPTCWKDPYSYYGQLRTRAPIARTHEGPWVLTSYRACLSALQNPRWERFPQASCMSDTVFSAAHESVPEGGSGPRQPTVLESVPGRDRLRRHFVKDFTPRAARAMETTMRRVTGELLDTMLQSDEADLIESFAIPYPAAVLAELLGVPAIDRHIFREWSYTLMRTADVGFVKTRPDSAESDRVSREISEYVGALLDERRTKPQDDLLSRMLTLEEGEDPCSEEQIIGTAVTILIVGHHTTTDLIGNGTVALLSHPEELARFRANTEIAPLAIEELLRYDGPSQFATRYALDDLEFEGQRVRKGDMAVLFLGSANRDPAAFSDPDRLDLSRQEKEHLGFGQGHGYCFGAPLGSLLARVAFTTLLHRVPKLALAGEPRRLDLLGLRGMESVPVSLR